MGQCVSCKSGAVIATGHHASLPGCIMEKHGKTCSKGTRRGAATSFGFRRHPIRIPVAISNYSAEPGLTQPRSKSAGPEQNRRRDEDNTGAIRNLSSGRSTPRLTPPKKDATGNAVRTNRFGYKQPQVKFTNKVGDICSSHTVSHYNQESLQQHQQESVPKQTQRVASVVCNTSSVPASKIRSPARSVTIYNNVGTSHVDGNRRPSGIREPVGRYTLHTSHLPLPQFAVRITNATSKTAKTAANLNRMVSAGSKGSTSSKEGSSTEDSGVGSQQGCTVDDTNRGYDYTGGSPSRRRGIGRPRNLRMVVNGKSFDVRDVRDEDSTVTEISVIPLPKTYTAPGTGLVRERTTQYQRIVNKDNRHAESTTSMSTTSSEGYDEGLGEEKVYKDRSRSEKIPSIKSDFSPPSSDDPEYGHGEAMADEYSLSSSDECHRSSSVAHHMQAAANTAKNGTLPRTSLRSVLLTIEDPAFAAAAATSTSLIDDETSPVDSLFDSLTASITQSDVKAPRKEQPMEQSGNTLDDDSPGTPTNASNSLSLSEGREFFDDEIADQPGLILNENMRVGAEAQSNVASQLVTENSHTLVESSPKAAAGYSKNATNSPHHGKRMSRAGSVDTLSPCESIASDDMILDYEQSDASSFDERQRMEATAVTQDTDEPPILSNLVAQGEHVMRRWSSLLGTCQSVQQTNNTNTINNNLNGESANNNNQAANEMGGSNIMASSMSPVSASGISRGAKRRTVLSTRTAVASANVNPANENGLAASPNGRETRDSGLSSDSSTPTAGSPVPRQRKTTSNPLNNAHSSSIPRAIGHTTRNDCDKTNKAWRSRSVTDSPRFLDSTRNRQFASPLRTSRNVQSPTIDRINELDIRIDRDAYADMFQDIVSIKTTVLKLKQLLQGSEENGLKRAETLTPFDNTIKNGLFYNLNEGDTADVNTSPGSEDSSIVDEVADLRRQIVFLQGQVEDKDRTIQVLQFQMSKLQGPNNIERQNCAITNSRNNILSMDTCNAATQTDKTRPGSAGTSLLQTLPRDGVMGPVVSWSDSWDRQRSTLPAEPNSARSPCNMNEMQDRLVPFKTTLNSM